MSLKRPSYTFMMVFLVLIYIGRLRCRLYLKQACAKSVMDSSVLYMAMDTPGLMLSITVWT